MLSAEGGRKISRVLTPALFVLGGIAISQYRENRQLKWRSQQYYQWLGLMLNANQKLYLKNQELAHKASHDQLTGLLNKQSWKEIIEQRQASGKPFGVIFMDMNAFKAVNDSPAHGHEVGDELLANFGTHLRESFRREHDALARGASRYGGDEFGFIVDFDNSAEQRAGSPETQMAHTLDYLRAVVDGFTAWQDPSIIELGFGFAVGGALWSPDNPVSTRQLLGQADAAMYTDKRQQGGAR